jgi:hypothetical protein
MEDPSSPTEADEEANLPPGARLGKYEIVRLLGAGGMGSVYEATHTEIGKRVAVKTLAPAVAAIPGARQRFLREAQLTSRLRHPHIVDLTDMGTEGRVAYLVMELLAGEDLAHRLERTGPFAPRELVDLMLPVCSALITAHEAGIVHRDLKPQNIFLASGHQGVAPKVLDFGISKSSDTDASSSLTSTGSVIGTPHYLAPEQIKDARTASPASDQYALGVIFYKCLTNVNPFEGESIFAVLQAISTLSPTPLGERRPDLPEGFEEVVARAMNPLPWERFGSVRELGRALLPYASPKARMIWEETFAATAAEAVALAEALRASQTAPMPVPEPRAARRAAEHTTSKARLDSGTLAPAVTDTATASLRRAPGSARRRVLVGTLVGAALAVGVVVSMARLSRGPEAPTSGAASAAPAAATAVAPPSAPPIAADLQKETAAKETAAKEALAKEAAAKDAAAKETLAKETLAKEAAAKEAASPHAAKGPGGHRRGPSSHHAAPAPRAAPASPTAPVRSFNPNGSPVID